MNDNLDAAFKDKFLKDFKKNYVEAVRPEQPQIKYEIQIHLTSGNKKPFYFQPRRLSYFEA